jgi:hypothetical protein
MKKLLTGYLLACGSIAMADTLPVSAADFYFWDEYEVVSGTVTEFASEFNLKDSQFLLVDILR